MRKHSRTTSVSVFRNEVSGAMDGTTAAYCLDRLARGDSWSDRQVFSFMEGAVNRSIDQSQVAAFLMAVACRGLSRERLYDLTMSYVNSGTVLRRDEHGPVADKHSTGGVGDKLTFLVCPLVAAAGGRVRKMSGASLRHCSGTIDKLSALSDFRHETDIDGFLAEVERFGFSIVPQSAALCPADALTYGIRNRCGSTGSAELIAASIMSKKIATGASGLVLDIKMGAGGLFESDARATMVARVMLEIARASGIRARAFLTDMSRPLGRAIGGASEVAEALDTLGGGGDYDTRALALDVAASMLVSSGHSTDEAVARQRLESVLDSGAARQRFCRWLASRGADAERVAADFGAARGVPIRSARSGYVESIAPAPLGRLARDLGAPGRITGNIVLAKTVGERVMAGETLARVDDGTHAARCVTEEHLEAVRRCFRIVEQKSDCPPRVLGVLDQTDDSLATAVGAAS